MHLQNGINDSIAPTTIHQTAKPPQRFVMMKMMIYGICISRATMKLYWLLVFTLFVCLLEACFVFCLCIIHCSSYRLRFIFDLNGCELRIRCVTIETQQQQLKQQLLRSSAHIVWMVLRKPKRYHTHHSCHWLPFWSVFSLFSLHFLFETHSA